MLKRGRIIFPRNSEHTIEFEIEFMKQSLTEFFFQNHKEKPWLFYTIYNATKVYRGVKILMKPMTSKLEQQ